MVRLYRTFSIYIVTGETRSAGCLCNFIEPSPYTSIVPVCRVLSHHRTSIPAAVQEIQCVQGGCALVRGGSSTSNLIENLHEPHHHRDSKVCRGLSHEFGVVRLYRSFSIYIVTGETRSAGCLCNFIEPSHYTSIVPVCRVLSQHRTSIPAAVQEIQCVQGGCALVRGGSSSSNLIENLHEPHHHRDSKVCRGL